MAKKNYVLSCTVQSGKTTIAPGDPVPLSPEQATIYERAGLLAGTYVRPRAVKPGRDDDSAASGDGDSASGDGGA